MVEGRKDALDIEHMTALDDHGYFNAADIPTYERAGIIPLMPKPLPSNSEIEGRFDNMSLIVA